MFDLNQASEGNSGKSFQIPGIFDNVKVSEVVLEKTSKAQVPYMRLVTSGPNGEIGSSAKMFLSTDIKKNDDGSLKKTSGWGVTARVLLELVKATNNVDEEAAKKLMGTPANEQALSEKVSALLVGKPFRGKFSGSTNEKGYIYAELSRTESMRVTPTQMYYDATKDIKPYNGPSTTTTNTESVEMVNLDDLPFG